MAAASPANADNLLNVAIFAGAMAGAFYGLVAIRQGVGAAVVAHVVTNLLLGLYVIHTGQWGFW